MFSLLIAFIYLSFISLGLPDSLLGSAWPIMYREFEVDVSLSGIVFMIIASMTVVSSLQSDRVTKKLGAGKVTAISVAMTAVALLGFATSKSFIPLCIWAVPYGLGAGSVDAALNNYVALHYSSKHMSWLHCMWGVGASIGPYIMSGAIRTWNSWNYGYGIVGILQVVLSFSLFMSLPLWKKPEDEFSDSSDSGKVLSLKEIFAIRGAGEIFLAFFCYSAVEQTVGLWASSYLVLNRGIDAKTAAAYASFFYLGITVGRAVNGFLTMKFSDNTMIRTGCAVILLGVIMVIVPVDMLSLFGLIVIGLGCAPIYPCIIHSTPVHFGRDKSQAMVGVQMASAYTGTTIMPPVFGLLAAHVSIGLFPVYLFVFLALMFLMHEIVVKKTA